jgi:hypothetical protein
MSKSDPRTAINKDGVDNHTGRLNSRFEADKYQVNEHVYPADLLSNNTPYGYNYVVFYINVSQDSRMFFRTRKNEFVEDIDPRLAGVAQEAKLNAASAAVGVFGQNAIVGGALGSAFGFRHDNRPSPILRSAVSGVRATAVSAGIATGIVASQAVDFSRTRKRLKTAIMLHMPNELRTSYNIVWGEHDLKNFMLGAQGSEALVNAVKSLGTFSSSEIADKFKQLGAGGAALALSMPNTQGLQAATGLAPNPKKEMLFNAVNFREFQMTYQFFPKNPMEAQLVRNIIDEFAYHMHPEYKDDKKFLYLYPSEFDIHFYHKDTENNNLRRRTSCALVNMSLDEAPNGMFNSLEDGMPPQINVTLHFKELATLSKEEIEKGY